MISLAAVVATYNRTELLANRSLPSIARQTRLPDHLVVVDDSDADVRRANACVVADFKADWHRDSVYRELPDTWGIGRVELRVGPFAGDGSGDLS